MARKRPSASPAWMDTKISATLIAFGMPLIEQLPPDASAALRQDVMSFIAYAWNVHVMVMPAWGQAQHLDDMRAPLPTRRWRKKRWPTSRCSARGDPSLASPTTRGR